MPKFLKRGAAAQQALTKADAQTEAKKAAAGSIQRFWMPDNTETSITFLDGDVGENGMLDVPMFWEHQLQMNGHWRNWFPCTQDEEICPICEDGNTPSLVTVLSIIDHSEYTDNQQKLHKDEQRLFVCKRDTYKLLHKKALKKGGLTGWRVDVMRSGDKSANVGNDFEFIERTENTPKPFNYDEVFKDISADQLRELGFGSGAVPTPKKAEPKQHSGAPDAKTLEEEL